MAGAGGLPFIPLPRIVGRARGALQPGETDAVVYLRGTITWESALRLKLEIEFLVEAGVKQIDIMISSGGGIADAALMLVDLIEGLKNEKVKVRTIVDGTAASAATLVSVAGHERWIHKRGWLMLHLPSMVTSGPSRIDSAELAVAKDNVDQLVEKMKNVYKENLHKKGKGGDGEIKRTTEKERNEAFAEIVEQLDKDNCIEAAKCERLMLVDYVGLPPRKTTRERNSTSGDGRIKIDEDVLKSLISFITNSRMVPWFHGEGSEDRAETLHEA